MTPAGISSETHAVSTAVPAEWIGLRVVLAAGAAGARSCFLLLLLRLGHGGSFSRGSWGIRFGPYGPGLLAVTPGRRRMSACRAPPSSGGSRGDRASGAEAARSQATGPTCRRRTGSTGSQAGGSGTRSGIGGPGCRRPSELFYVFVVAVVVAVAVARPGANGDRLRYLHWRLSGPP